MEYFIKFKGIAPYNTQKDEDGGLIWKNLSTHKSTQLTKTLKLQERPTHKEFVMNTTITLETLMEALHIHVCPRQCGMHYTPQSHHIHIKDISITSVIHVLSNKNIAMMREANNFSVRYS